MTTMSVPDQIINGYIQAVIDKSLVTPASELPNINWPEYIFSRLDHIFESYPLEVRHTILTRILTYDVRLAMTIMSLAHVAYDKDDEFSNERAEEYRDHAYAKIQEKLQELTDLGIYSPPLSI